MAKLDLTTRVRMYQKKDYEPILEMVGQLESEMAARFKRRPFSESAKFPYKNHLLVEGTKYFVVVAETVFDAPIGFAVGVPVTGITEFDRSHSPVTHSVDEVTVGLIYVAHGFRDKNHAKLLLNGFEAESRARSHKFVSAYVAHWNESSCGLFRSMRYVEERHPRRYLFKKHLSD